ncbi:HIT-type Zinc finger family protein isoform X2 [Tasmannia lanceolata]
MRENVMEELRQMLPEDETKQKMIDILKRFHSEEEMDSVDEDDSMLSEETIQKFLSGNQVSLDDLSPEEMKQFQRAVASGELGKMIEPWNPWWLKPSARTISLSHKGTQLVSPFLDGQEMAQLSEIPPGPASPPQPVSKLISTEPSPLLSFHLIDIVYSYCFTLRLYNGDWQSDALGAAIVALSMSSVLGEGPQPETVAEALVGCLERTCSPTYKHAGGLRFGLGLIDDTVSLFSLGGAALVCLLCDLQRLLQSGERELKSDKQRKVKKGERSKLRLADRKVYFMMCWAYEQPADVWSSLSAIVGIEKASFATLELGGKPVKMEGEGECKGKGLIEEV